MKTRTLTWLNVALFVVSLAAVGWSSRPGPRWHPALVSAAQAKDVDHVNHGCSTQTLKGPFGFSFSGGAVIGGFEGKPGAVVGLITFDGRGQLTGVVTANANGRVLPQREIQGTYTVNPDCTGSVTAAAVPVPLLTFQADGVIVSDGAEILVVGTNPELVFSGVAKKL